MSGENNKGSTDGYPALEIIEFDEFHPVDESAPKSNEASKRRFMTLIAESDSRSLKGGVGKVRKVRSVAGEIFACKTLHRPKESPTAPGADPSKAARDRMLSDSVFGEEYRTQSLLSNMRGFPKLYGYGMHHGYPVLVMEWVEGYTLSKAVAAFPKDETGTVDVRTIAAIGLAVLEVLENTRSLDVTVVHRDLSPNNIMIRTTAHSLEDQYKTGKFDVCLVDFGSSTLVDDVNPAFTKATNIWRHGTPEYAAPEMLTNDIPNATVLRSSPLIDVYALSSVLYEMYSGRTPHALSEVKTASRYRYKVENMPPMLQVKSGMDEALVGCIMRGLSVAQVGRPSMEEYIDVLKARLDGTQPQSMAWRGNSSQMQPVQAMSPAPVMQNPSPAPVAYGGMGVQQSPGMQPQYAVRQQMYATPANQQMAGTQSQPAPDNGGSRKGVIVLLSLLVLIAILIAVIFVLTSGVV